LAGPFSAEPPFSGNRIRSVLNSVAAGRRQAYRVLTVQAVATGLAALVFLVQGERDALGALSGGGAVTLGTALMAWRMFDGGVRAPGAALARMFGGLVLKWLVIAGVLLGAMIRLELPPVAIVAGLCAALAANLLVFSIKS
jgi:ATP synthase protein I